MDAIQVKDETIRIRPRLVRKLRLVAVLGLIGGPVLLAMGIWDAWQVSRLREEGHTVEGTVVESQALATGKGRTSHRLTVEYRPDGLPRHRKHFLGVPVAVAEAAQASGKVPVRYLPGRPFVAMVGDAARIDTEPMAIGAGVFLAGLAGTIYLRRRNQQIDRAMFGPAD